MELDDHSSNEGRQPEPDSSSQAALVGEHGNRAAQLGSDGINQDESTIQIELKHSDIDVCTNTSRLRTEMMYRIAHSQAHFKHQQRGEPDLTVEQKLDIANTAFDKNRVTFLSRFGKYLVEADLKVFESREDDYEIAYYLDEIRKTLDDKMNSVKIRNRRFEAMKHITSKGEYFNEDSMKSRDPLLYEQMVGQYLTEEQVQSRVENKDLGFASILLQHVQALQENELYDRLKDVQDGQHEEEESDEEDMEVIADEKTTEDGISALDKQILKNEFLRTMQLRFLNGEDKLHFNYRDVDENVEYDSLDIRGHDEEEKYFDEDDDVAGNNSVEKDITERVPLNGQAFIDDDSDEIDYETFQVQNDIRPGLLDSFCDVNTTSRKENVANDKLKSHIENG